MRYRVKKDFVLNGTLLLFGESLFLQKEQSKEENYEVYSFFSRQLIGIVNKTEIETYLEQTPSPTGKHAKGNKTFKDITLVLLWFIIPLGASSQVIIPFNLPVDPIRWSTKMVQTEDNIFELHLAAKIDSNWFLYPLNERKKCELCPILRLEPSPYWEAIDGPELYYYSSKVPPERCGSLPSPYCPVIRYTDSVMYIQVIRSKVRQNLGVRGYVTYYPTHKDSTGQSKTLMFARSLYSTSEQPITRTTVP